MKKFQASLIALSITVIMASFAACSANGTDAPPAGSPSAEPAQTAENPDRNAEQNSEQPGSNAPNMVSENSDYGEVSEIIGNLVTLKLIDRPQGRTITPGEGAPSNGEGGGDGTFFFGGDNAGMASPPAGGDGTFFFSGDGSGTGGSGGSPGGRGNYEPNYTGEEKEILIPVGVPIVTMSYSESGPVESEVKIEKISAGDTLLISYDEDGKTVTRVMLMSAESGGFFIQRSTDASGN